MRVTQSMLSSNMLRNLNTSYSNMSKLQNQINTGSKINRPSDDPVVAVKGMSYRTDLNKVDQFERNMNEVNTWLDTSDEALGQVGEAVNRVKELLVQAANDTNTADDREKMKAEIDQIRLQIQDLANTKVADKYVFSGTNTQKPLFISVEHRQDASDPTSTLVTSTVINSKFQDEDGVVQDPMASLLLADGTNGKAGVIAPSGEVKMEVFDGIELGVNTSGANLFGRIDSFMGKISEALTRGSASNNGESISELLGGVIDISALDSGDDDLSKLQNSILEARADVGAKQNRVDMMTDRLATHKINVTKQMSNNEDVDYSKAITELVTHESIHQASLSTGAKIIQQTLVDFIR